MLYFKWFNAFSTFKILSGRLPIIVSIWIETNFSSMTFLTYMYILPICNFWKSYDRIKQSILYFVGNRTFHYYRSSLRCAHSSIQLFGSSIINFFFHFSQPIKTFETCFLFRFYFSFSSDIYLEKSLRNG